ncbi:MAG: SAM-dependent methyltransferase [Hyphomicrobiales bacterium]|nr:MAG: SAM-dependent methyltransferase [Hyphomicrobiales bacterium]
MNSSQSWSPDSYNRDAGFVSVLGSAVLEWLAPKSGERVLDLGCGDGSLTERLVEAGADVAGIDASPDFVEAARARGLAVTCGDGHALSFDREFDAVFSNAALHWMTQPEKVVAGVARALKPGGRFVAEFGGHGNVAAIVTAMRAAAQRFGGDATLADPWFFPTPDEYAALLEEKGFSVERIALIPRPTPLPTGMAAWLEVFRAPFFDQFGVERQAVLDAVVELLAPSLRDVSGNWTADYVRLRVSATLAQK